MYHSVLIPLDGSAFAEQALPFALSIARRAAASVQLAAVGTDHFNSTRDYLDRIAARIHRQLGLSVTRQLLEGEEVAETICSYVERSAIDLAVMATHGKGALGRVILGSVSYAMMSRSRVPLLLVKPHDDAAKSAAAASIKKVLVILDPSNQSEGILDAALSLNQTDEAEFTLMRVIANIPVGAPELDSISLCSAAPELLEEIRMIRERNGKEAQDYLNRHAERLENRGVRVRTRVIGVDELTIGIRDEANASRFDVIALRIGESDGGEGVVSLNAARGIIRECDTPILVQAMS